jgi:hypothetical protein
MYRRSIVVVLVVTAALGVLSAEAGAAHLRARPRASAAPGGQATASAAAGAPCRSIDAYYDATYDGGGYFLLFTCFQPVNGFTFTPGGDVSGGELEYGSAVTECFSSQGGDIVNSPLTCTADPAPIPANTTIRVFYEPSVTCQASGIHVVVTVDSASSFTVNGTCAGQGMGVSVKSLTGSARGYRVTLHCGLDGSNCEADTLATDLGPKDKGYQLAYGETSIDAGATKTVTVPLKSLARSLLVKDHSLTAKVAVTGFQVTDSEPGPATKVLSKTVRIK